MNIHINVSDDGETINLSFVALPVSSSVTLLTANAGELIAALREGVAEARRRALTQGKNLYQNPNGGNPA